MRADKIFTNENGDRYKIIVALSTDSYGDKHFWDIIVYFCPKGKRKWLMLNCQDDHEYRALDLKERDNYYKKFILSHISANWITEVQQLIISALNKPIV